MRTPLRLTAALLAVGLAVGLAGCESTAPIPVPTEHQLEGTWHHGSVTLKLEDGGVFFLTGIPEGVVRQSSVAAGAAPKGPKVDVSGSWDIGSGGNDAGGVPGVQLDFTRPPKVGPFDGLTLLVDGAAPSIQLYVFLGRSDSDNKYAFTK